MRCWIGDRGSKAPNTSLDFLLFGAPIQSRLEYFQAIASKGQRQEFLQADDQERNRLKGYFLQSSKSNFPFELRLFNINLYNLYMEQYLQKLYLSVVGSACFFVFLYVLP